MTMRSLPFGLVDVFATEPLSGNSLSVFLIDDHMSKTVMQSIAQEMRQFETIFLQRSSQPSTFYARVFTMEEELPFAGHPVIGAAATLHSKLFPREDEVRLEFVMHERSIPVMSRRKGEYFVAEMDQGLAKISAPLPSQQYQEFLEALNLSGEDVAKDLPLQVVSTGLPYLIVPITSNLESARIVVPDFESLLATVGAKFVYVLDVNGLEGRSWENDASVEDAATGSAAGPAAAYLVMHEYARIGETIVFEQGRLVNRPSQLYATVRGSAQLSVTISGPVCLVGEGVLRLPQANG